MGLSHFKGISVTPDPRGSTACEITGTTSITGNPSITGNVGITGNAAVSGIVSATGGVTINVGGALKITTGANGCCGIKLVGTAGTGRVATTKVTADARILLTPKKYLRGISASVGYASAGTAFQIRLTRAQTAGTIAGCTGAVSWLIIDG